MRRAAESQTSSSYESMHDMAAGVEITSAMMPAW